MRVAIRIYLTGWDGLGSNNSCRPPGPSSNFSPHKIPDLNVKRVSWCDCKHIIKYNRYCMSIWILKSTLWEFLVLGINLTSKLSGNL